MIPLALFLLGCHLAATQAATAAVPDQHAPSSFSTCDTGTSRLLLANAAHLPPQCKPGHNDFAAAVLDCFSNCKVVVHKCHVSLYPRPSSKLGLDCRSMHAQGLLTGSTNASLVAVLDSTRAVVALLNSSTTFKGYSKAALQSGVVKALHMLFAEVLVQRNGSGSSSGSSTAHSKSNRERDAGVDVSTPQSAMSAQLQQPNSTAAASISVHGDASLDTPLPVKHVHQLNATGAPAGAHHPQGSSGINSSSNSSLFVNRTASLSKDTHTGAQSALPAGTASLAASASTTAAQHGRRLSWRHLQSLDATGCVFGENMDHAEPFARSVTALFRVLAALGTPTSESPVRPSLGRNGTQGRAKGVPVGSAGAMAGASAKSRRGAVLFRQGSSIVLQPSSGCQYQFLVTRNPRILQPDKQLAAAVGHRHHKKKSGWWVSAAAVFTAVSAVLAVAVCYMSVQIWRRYKCYQALPSEPAEGNGQQSAVRSTTSACTNSADGLNAAPVGASAWSSAEMSLEMQSTGVKSSMHQWHEGRDMASLHDQVRR